MDLGPEEKSFKFWEVSRNRALKRFAQFFVQPAAERFWLKLIFAQSSKSGPYGPHPVVVNVSILVLISVGKGLGMPGLEYFSMRMSLKCATILLHLCLPERTHTLYTEAELEVVPRSK